MGSVDRLEHLHLQRSIEDEVILSGFKTNKWHYSDCHELIGPVPVTTLSLSLVRPAASVSVSLGRRKSVRQQLRPVGVSVENKPHA